MIKYFLIARKIHRLLVLVIVSFSLVMAVTGSLLKYSFISSQLSFIDLGMVRYVHNQLSSWLVVILLLMSVTGLIMFFPLRPKKPV